MGIPSAVLFAFVFHIGGLVDSLSLSIEKVHMPNEAKLIVVGYC